MIIIGLDIAHKTGWVVGNVHSDRTTEWMESGVENFKPDKNTSRGISFLKFRKWFGDLVTAWEPDLVMYEQPHMRGKDATTVLMGYITRLIEVCDTRTPQVQYDTVQTNTLKKFATGKGNAGKPEMIEKAKHRFPGLDIIDDNHADALHVFQYAVSHYV